MVNFMKTFCKTLKKIILVITVGLIAGFFACVFFSHSKYEVPEIKPSMIPYIQKARNCNPENEDRWFMGMRTRDDTLVVFFHEPGNELVVNLFGKEFYIASAVATIFSTQLIFTKDSIQCIIP